MIAKNELMEKHPGDIAEFVEAQPDSEQFLTFMLLPSGIKSEVFSYLSQVTQFALIKRLGAEQTAEILEHMAPDDRTELFENFPDSLIKESINLLSENEKHVALSLIGYPRECVARLMSPNYVQARKDWTVAHTFEHIRRFGKKAETLNFIYIVDEQNHLIDDLRIGKLLMADADATIESIMDYHFEYLTTLMSKEDAIERFDKYDRAALPVVTENKVLVGIVTFDDIIDEIEKVNTEDFQKLAAMEALDVSYTDAGVGTMFRKRATWLIVLFFGELLTTSAMAYFDAEIAKAVVLAVFVPLIISAGGNSGSQAATLIVRAMALKEVRLRDWFFVLRKELISGLMLGGVLGFLGFSRVAGWHLFGVTDYGPHWFAIASAIALALLGVVMWGTIVGSMIPFILKRFRVDPATSSAPFVATLVDVTGLLLYFSVAMLLLGGKLL